MFKTYSLIKKWHVIGFFWIVIVGSLLHFTYEWSGNSKIVGYFSPVNESLWEHLKLGYFSLTFFILVEFWALRNKTDTYFIAKSAGIISMSIFVILISYIYELITKDSNVFFHIGLFILGSFICQFISMNIMKLSLGRRANLYGIIAYLVFGILLIVLTPYQLEAFFYL